MRGKENPNNNHITIPACCSWLFVCRLAFTMDLHSSPSSQGAWQGACVSARVNLDPGPRGLSSVLTGVLHRLVCPFHPFCRRRRGRIILGPIDSAKSATSLLGRAVIRWRRRLAEQTNGLALHTTDKLIGQIRPGLCPGGEGDAACGNSWKLGAH